MHLRLLTYPAIALLLAYPSTLDAQILKSNSLFDKVKHAASGLDNSSWKPGAAITTSIKDSLPAIRFFNEADFDAKDADTVGSFALRPGYYRTTIRTYCLHAGAYGASKGNGYQIARLKGNQATLVSSILERSAAHEEIAQRDVQLLIWGIEAGQKFTDYDHDFQLRVKPLLTEKDIALMQVKVSSIAARLMPEGMKEMAETYSSIRGKMDKTQMNYDDIEKVAVKVGVPPTGLGSVEIPRGLWGYVGDGYFVRAFPRNYTTTDLEIYRPGHFEIKKDDKGRIVGFSRGGESVTIEYDDDPGADVVAISGKPSIAVWRFRRFAYVNSAKGISEEVRNRGWILQGQPEEIFRHFAAVANGGATAKHGPNYQMGELDLNSETGETGETAETDAATAETVAATDETVATTAGPSQTKQPINWEDLYARYKEVKQDYSNAKEAVEWSKRLDDAGKLKDYDEYLNEKNAEDMIAKGLKAASNPTDFKKKMDWIADLLKMDRDLGYWITCRLAGTCNDNNDPATPGLPSKVAQPGDAGCQRLGMSPVKKLPMYQP